MELRKYQKKDFKALKKSLKKHNHVLFGAATGYGKSAIIYNIVNKNISKNKRVLVIAPRRKLIKQLSDTLSDFIPSIIMGSDSTYYENADVYMASTPTLNNRLKKYGRKYLGKLDTIIIDEAHVNFGSASMQELIKLYWGKCNWIGLSATPIDDRGYRLEGWDKTIYNNQTQTLIDIGYLTPVKVLVEDTPKGLDDLKMVGGDYNEKDLSNFMMDGARVSNVYQIWKKYAKGRRVMIFAVTIAHADMILEDFLKNKVKAVVVHSNIDEQEEDSSLLAFKEGEIDVIINVGKLTMGFDETSVDCLILARPTKLLRLFIQIIGRGLRLHEGKKNCLILDIAGTITEHGFPTQYRDFNKVRPSAKKKVAMEFTEIECHNCGYNTQIRNCSRKVEENKHITITRWYCPLCDEVIKETSVDNKKVKRLKEIQDYTNISKVTGADVHRMVRAIQKHKDYKQGWVTYVGDDWKRSKHIRNGMKLIYKKWDLEMVTLDTALTNINKLRSEYEKA